MAEWYAQATMCLLVRVIQHPELHKLPPLVLDNVRRWMARSKELATLSMARMSDVWHMTMRVSQSLIAGGGDLSTIL